MPDFELAPVDLAIVALYVVAILAIGFWVGRRKQSSEAYFLAGRGAVWPLVGFGLVAANLSGTSYVGLAGAGYHDGIAVWNYEWMATLVLVFFALFILPFYLRSKVDTMPEFLERRYGRRSRYAFSVFTIFTGVLIDSAGALFAGGLVLHLLFPDVPLLLLIVSMALLGGVYVILGGLHAVMITDTVQGILLLLAGAVLFVLLFQELGSWEAVRAAAPEDGFTVFKPADDGFLPWPGLFTGVIWLGFYYWTTNHVVVQKVLAARSVDHARWGALFAGLIQLPFLFVLVLPGTMGRAIYPDLDMPDQIWPALAFDFLPVGLRGLVLAALVAALMSTLDSVLNGTASLVVNDFVRTRRRAIGDRALLAISRATVGVFMIAAALWAPVLFRFEGIVEYFQSFLGYVAMPVVVLFLGGLFWRRATEPAAFWTLVVAAPVGFIAFLGGEIFEWFAVQFLYAAGAMLMLSVVLFVAISRATEPPADDRLEFTWSRQSWDEETAALAGRPAWQSYRVLALVLVAVTLLMVVVFA